MLSDADMNALQQALLLGGGIERINFDVLHDRVTGRANMLMTVTLQGGVVIQCVGVEQPSVEDAQAHALIMADRLKARFEAAGGGYRYELPDGSADLVEPAVPTTHHDQQPLPEEGS